jgi:hypothetical protein
MRGPARWWVTVWTSGCGSRKAAREPRVSTVGAKPSIPVSSSAPAAWPVCWLAQVSRPRVRRCRTFVAWLAPKDSGRPSPGETPCTYQGR